MFPILGRNLWAYLRGEHLREQKPSVGFPAHRNNNDGCRGGRRHLNDGHGRGRGGGGGRERPELVGLKSWESVTDGWDGLSFALWSEVMTIIIMSRVFHPVAFEFGPIIVDIEKLHGTLSKTQLSQVLNATNICDLFAFLHWILNIPMYTNLFWDFQHFELLTTWFLNVILEYGIQNSWIEFGIGCPNRPWY